MSESIRKIFIGGGEEAKKRVNEGWFSNENGSSGTTIAHLRKDPHKATLIAGSDAQTCIAAVVTSALTLGADLVTVHLEDIKSHRETGSCSNPLEVRAKDLAFSLNQFDQVDHPKLNVTPPNVWSSAKSQVKKKW